MLFITEYRLKPHMSKAEVARLMDVFGKRGPGPGETAHYVRVDSTGGFTVSDLEDSTAAYESALAYTEFITFTVTPVLKIDDAVGPITNYLS
jgi:fermentation-respiration switch protein FrsA (DUF1100 family)